MLLIATFADAILLTRRAGETMELLLSAFSQSASGRLLGDAHVVISKFVQRRRCSVSVLPAGLGLFPGSKLRFSSASERFSVRSCVSIRPKSAPNLNIATQKWSWKDLNGQEPLRYRQRLDGGEKRRKGFFLEIKKKKLWQPCSIASSCCKRQTLCPSGSPRSAGEDLMRTTANCNCMMSKCLKCSF